MPTLHRLQVVTSVLQRSDSCRVFLALAEEVIKHAVSRYENGHIPQADHPSVVVAPASKPSPVVSCRYRFNLSAYFLHGALGLNTLYH